MKNNGFAPIVIIIVIVALLGIGAGGFVLFSKNKTSSPLSPSLQTETSPTLSPLGSVPQQDEKISAKQLLGLWQKNEDGFVGFLEFKENEFCANWSGGTPEKFLCGQYLPYAVSGNKIFVNVSGDTIPANSSPWAEWKIVNGKLEFKPKSQLDKDIYEKIR